MTTRPLIPFSKSIRDDLMIRNKALKRSIWKRRKETRFRLDIACEQTPFKGEKNIRWVKRVVKREKRSTEARLDYYVQDYCILMRCILFGSITKRRFHITSQLCVLVTFYAWEHFVILFKRWMLFISITKRRFHINCVRLGDLLRMRILSDAFHKKRAILGILKLEIEESLLDERACLPIEWKTSWTEWIVLFVWYSRRQPSGPFSLATGRNVPRLFTCA